MLSYADLAPGMLLNATVLAAPEARTGEGDLRLGLAEGVSGRVPPLHAAELSGGGSGSAGGGRKLGKVKAKASRPRHAASNSLHSPFSG